MFKLNSDFSHIVYHMLYMILGGMIVRLVDNPTALQWATVLLAGLLIALVEFRLKVTFNPDRDKKLQPSSD